MQKGGWIPISLVASFHRVQALTQNVTLIIEVGSACFSPGFQKLNMGLVEKEHNDSVTLMNCH